MVAGNGIGGASGRTAATRRPTGWLVIAGTLVLIALGWSALLLLIKRETNEAIENAATANATYVRAFSEHARSGIKLIDAMSWRIASEIERVGMGRVNLGVYLRQIDAALPFIQQIGVMDSDGNLVASAPEYGRVNLADREHFRVHRDNRRASLFIATPIRYRTSGKWTIPLSRRLYSSDGGFLGVLTIGLDGEYFSSYYSRVSPAGVDGMAIARSDGVVLVRRVGDEVVFADSALDRQWFKESKVSTPGWSVVTGGSDGVSRLAAYDTMADYPLLLALGTPLELVLAPVRHRLPTYYTVAGAVSAVLLLSACLIAMLFHRQRRINGELASSEERFRSLTALSADWYWEQDEEFRLTYQSSTYGKAGQAVGPKLGSRRWDVPALNLSESDWEAHRAVLQRHEPFLDFEMARATPEGGRVWVALSGEPVFSPEGTFTGYRGIARNITERKRTEYLLALEHSIARALAADEATDHIMRTVIRTMCETQGWECGRYFSFDRSAGILRLADAWIGPNPALAGFLAASRDMDYRPGEGLAGTAWLTREPQWEADVVVTGKGKYREVAKQYGLRSAFVFPALAEGEATGVFAFTDTRPRPPDERLIQASRAIGSMVGLFLQRRANVQEIRRLNVELEQRVSDRTAELQAAVKELEAFSYTVAHDLRSPLRAMNGYCEILLEDHAAALPAEAQDHLRRIAANAGRLGRLIDDLLAFSRCSRAVLTREKVDMSSLFASVIAEHVPGQRPAQICLDKLPAAMGDPALLRQVAENLVSNALKYSRKSPQPRIEIGHAEGAYFVRDNGVGFDMQYADKLFGVFSRLHRFDEFEGTGVGLAIVKRIVDRHTGRCWAQSELGRGATFFFTLGQAGRVGD